MPDLSMRVKYRKRHWLLLSCEQTDQILPLTFACKLALGQIPDGSVVLSLRKKIKTVKNKQS